MNKIVVASDSFKGSLTSMQVANSAEKAIKEEYPDCEVVKVNVADGGEGTVDALVAALEGEFVSLSVSDPLGRPVTAKYGIVDGGRTAVIEMASASGLPLLLPSERSPLHTSTFGTGEMIVDAVRRGCRKILVGIGGSATNDAGMGMLSALGFRFLDAAGVELAGCGSSLMSVSSVDVSCIPQEILETEFVVACDVDNPFHGPQGAAYVFSPQKGASKAEVEILDKGLEHFANVVLSQFGKDISSVPGAGAAGGLGGGFLAFLNARLQRGVEMVLDALHFDDLLRGADLVITGEGKMDRQTSMGKTPSGVLERARKAGVPVAAVAGRVECRQSLLDLGFAEIIQSTPVGMPLREAMTLSVATENVRLAVKAIVKSLS